VILADGSAVKADACTNPDLFWALRGGGGGTFGIVTHVQYRVHAVTPITVLSWGLVGIEGRPTAEEFFPFATLWLAYWIEVSPHLENCWSGFFSAYAVHLTYMGTIEEAKLSFVNNFTEWYTNTLIPNTDMVAGVWGALPPEDSMEQHASWFDYKGGAESNGNPALTDQTGDSYAGLNGIAARLVPRDLVLQKPDETLTMLLNMIMVGSLAPINYFLGGAMMDVADDATAVHPAMRRAIWSMVTTDKVAEQVVRDFVPNDPLSGGVCFNHHSPTEPDWRQALWGANYDRLIELKNKYDPDHVFSCWHCVGYEGLEYGDDIPTTDTSTCPTAAGPVASPTAAGGPVASPVSVTSVSSALTNNSPVMTLLVAVVWMMQ